MAAAPPALPIRRASVVALGIAPPTTNLRGWHDYGSSIDLVVTSRHWWLGGARQAAVLGLASLAHGFRPNVTIISSFDCVRMTTSVITKVTTCIRLCLRLIGEVRPRGGK
jgi:hypothetical protein